MKTKNCIICLMVLLACSSAAHAQAGNSLQQRSIAEALDSWITTAERHVVPAADAMPEDKYAFAPDQTRGEFKGVRTFAQQVKHLAANNYGIASLILERRRTADMENETGPDSVTTKAEIVEYVKGSFAALHEAVATIDEKNVVQPTVSPSQWQKTRLSLGWMRSLIVLITTVIESPLLRETSASDPDRFRECHPRELRLPGTH